MNTTTTDFKKVSPPQKTPNNLSVLLAPEETLGEKSVPDRIPHAMNPTLKKGREGGKGERGGGREGKGLKRRGAMGLGTRRDTATISGFGPESHGSNSSM